MQPQMCRVYVWEHQTQTRSILKAISHQLRAALAVNGKAEKLSSEAREGTGLAHSHIL